MLKSFSKDSLKSKFVIVLVVGIVMALSLGAFAVVEKNVSVAVDGKIVSLKTTKSTVGDVLKEAKINLKEKDIVTPALDSKISEGDAIKITRALDVTIKVDGKLIKVRTLPATSSKILADAKIVVGAKDIVVPNRGTMVKKSGTVSVLRVKEKSVTRNYQVPFKVVKTSDDSLKVGTSKVLTQGVYGVKKEVYKVAYADGKMISKERVSRTFPKKAVSKVVAVGTKSTSRAGDRRDGAPSNYRKVLTCEATAYTHTGNRTATGTVAQVGVIAVDPRVIPLGTRVYVEGYGYATAEDTGGAIKGRIIDVFLDSDSQCRSWGRQQVNVYIL